MSNNEDQEDPSWKRDHVQSLEKGLAIIRCMGGAPELTLAEVAQRAGTTRPAARRFLLTLGRLGYVARGERGYYLLPRTLELGYAYLSSNSLLQVAHPHVQKLAVALDESCGLTILDGLSIVYVDRVTISRLVGASIVVGSTLPAYCTSAGRVLLSGLSDAALEEYLRDMKLEALGPKTITQPERLREEILKARKQGWYLIDQELAEGVRSIAAPVRDANGQVIAAVNVSSYSARVTLEAVNRTYKPRLLETVTAIQADLQFRR